MPKFQSVRSRARSLSLKSSASHSRMTSQRWTQEEHERLEHVICKLKLKPWSKVAAFIGGRTKRQCISHHQKCVQTIKNVNASSRWTKAECDLLQQARGDFKMEWKMVAMYVGTRDDTQCRSHYQKCNGTTSVHHRLVISDDFRDWILESAPKTSEFESTNEEVDGGGSAAPFEVADSSLESTRNDFCLRDLVYTGSSHPAMHKVMILDEMGHSHDETSLSLNTISELADTSNHPIEENVDTTMSAVSELLFDMTLAQADDQGMVDAWTYELHDTNECIAMVALLMEKPEPVVPLGTTLHQSDFAVLEYFGYPGCLTKASSHEELRQLLRPIYFRDV